MEPNPLTISPPELFFFKRASPALKTKSRLMDFRHFDHLVTAEPFSESQFWTGRAKFLLKATSEQTVPLLLAQGRYATCTGGCYWG